MPQPPKYQKTYKRPKAEDVFTDREQPFSVFETARNAIDADRPKLLTFYGIGGQGKSALCDALIRHFGTYSLSRQYDLIFSLPGSFIAGEDVVLFPWAQIYKSRT